MDGLILNAQRQINAALAELERETGSIVETVELRDIEVTTFSDDRTQWQRTVSITLRRLPGTKWMK